MPKCDCGASWSSSGLCHCKGSRLSPGCHESFGSTSAFDRHRKGGTCIPVSEFGKPRGKAGLPLLVRSGKGVWVTSLRKVKDA